MSTSGGPVDRATLEDLAAASRILADQGVFDAAGHVSMRHPNHPERFLMSRSLAPQMITADDIMEFDLDCNAIDARGRNGFIERYLHGEIFKARPDVMAIAHSHSASTIAFGLSNVPMREINREIWQFCVPLTIVLLLLIAFPAITLWLPWMFGYKG